MFNRAVSYDLLWDPSVCEPVDQSQQWVLAAMGRYGPELVTMLWRILGNDQDVCDAYQTTFLHLAHRPDRAKPRHMKAYLFRTASNTAITMLRRRLVESRTVSGMDGPAEHAPTPENEFDTKHLAESLRGHIARLPAHLQSVVTLHDLGELPYAKVARIMGISTGTARVYRCKAIQLLAAWMNRKEE